MPPPSKRRDIIVIGGSAGAIEPLRALVAHLPAGLAASIFVTIHIPADFPSILPSILRSAGPLPAVHPTDKERTRPGTIYVAPPDFHLLVEKGCVGISRGARENRHRPAIDPLTADALRVAMSASTEDALWAAMRTLEEKASLLRRLASRSAQRLAAQYGEEAATFDKHINTIRRILVENQEPEAREREQTDAA